MNLKICLAQVKQPTAIFSISLPHELNCNLRSNLFYQEGHGVVHQRFWHPKIDFIVQQQIIVNGQEQEGRFLLLHQYQRTSGSGKDCLQPTSFCLFWKTTKTSLIFSLAKPLLENPASQRARAATDQSRERDPPQARTTTTRRRQVETKILLQVKNGYHTN
jgi:hypothetical protein